MTIQVAKQGAVDSAGSMTIHVTKPGDVRGLEISNEFSWINQECQYAFQPQHKPATTVGSDGSSRPSWGLECQQLQSKLRRSSS